MALPPLSPCSAGMLSTIPFLPFDHFQPQSTATHVFSPASRSLAISIGSNLLNNSLTHFVRLLTPSIPPSAVLRAGALNLPSLTTSAAELQALKQAYAKSFDRIMIFALVLMCLGTVVACAMPWFNLKIVAADREKERAVLQIESAVPVEEK